MRIGVSDRDFPNMIMILPLLFLLGCARSAPNLPESRIGKTDAEIQKLLNINEADLAIACPALNAELGEVETQIENNELVIKGARTKNQVAGYFGVLFLIPLIGTDNNDAAKVNLEKLQVRKDQIFYLQDRNGCT